MEHYTKPSSYKESIPSRFMGTKELAKYIGISINSIYFWVYRKQIPYYKIGNLVKFDILEIDEWLKAKKILPRYPG